MIALNAIHEYSNDVVTAKVDFPSLVLVINRLSHGLPLKIIVVVVMVVMERVVVVVVVVVVVIVVLMCQDHLHN